jgi:hypothetical protein
MPLVDPDSIIQYMSGTFYDATGLGADFTVTLAAAAQVGNSLFMFSAATPTNMSANNYPGESWYDYFDAYFGSSQVDEPQFTIHTKFVTLAPRSSFPFRVFSNSHGVPTTMAWMMVEVSGCEPAWTFSGIPWDGDGNQPQYTYNGQAINTDFTGTVAQLSTGTGATTTQGNNLFVPVGFATTQLAGGTPMAATDFQNSATQPGVWTQIGANVAAVNGSSTSVGLDVAYKITPSPATYGCVANYAVAPNGGIACCTGAFFGDRIPANLVHGRAATNSMM